MTNYIFFDVGANNGSSSIPVALGNGCPTCWPPIPPTTSSIVYAFEPIPHLIAHIRNETAELSNYILTEVAVSDYVGTSTFNVSGENEGCSSLLTLSDNVLDKWYGRRDMLVTEAIEVNVIRLESFIETNNISHIDYLHIDTQGSDLNVLKGMGKYISIVLAGQIEAARIPEVLYKNQNGVKESVDFLEKNGFVIIGIHGNDPLHNESNIFFRRKDEQYPHSVPRPDWYDEN